MKESLLTLEYINECLNYDPHSGKLFWKHRPINHFKSSRHYASWNSRYKGTQAGALSKSGYLMVSINKKLYAAHRLAWIISHGEWPSMQIDHINRVRSDNRIKNLRDVTRSENQFNRGMDSRNKSGMVGVHYCKKTNAWCSTFGRKRIGRFKNIEDAIKSREDFERENINGGVVCR
ncbi:HNH endonuclease [Salmonella enterica]|nr:HNH endonuclease [Salmonella enterica]